MKQNIDYIILKVLQGDAIEEENQILIRWINDSHINEKVFNELKNEWDRKHPPEKAINEEELTDRIWNKAIHKRNTINRLTINLKFILKVAAALGLIVSSYIFIELYNAEPLIDQEFQTVVKSNESGEKSKIILSDGTTVWLNAESSISYNQPFVNQTREIKLTGEAYFEVAKDSTRPFIVRFDETTATVLGTSFNISSYNEDETKVISLIEGKLQINHGPVRQILTEGWIAKIDNKTNQIDSFIGDGQQHRSWTSGILIFKENSYEQIFKKLRRWYGVDIKIVGVPDPNMRFTGSFQEEYLTNVLENLILNGNMTYQVENNRVRVVFREL